jgi:hypothetical protein
MIVEQLVELRLAGENEVLGENPSQRHFVHHKSHLTRPLGGKPATNRLSYGAATKVYVNLSHIGIRLWLYNVSA